MMTGTLALAACKPVDLPTAPDASMAGTYALRTMAGAVLPYAVLQRPGFDLKVTSEAMTLNASGGFVDITSYARVNGAVVDFPVDTLTGTWSAFETNVKLLAKGVTFSGTVVGSTLTLNNGTLTSVYVK